tara:strand:- start:1811 stop:2128 length:318 start_codon:yes stop_codon:yes gene_type:complete
MGALGVHAQIETEGLSSWNLAVFYQLCHAVLLLFIGFMHRQNDFSIWLTIAGYLFAVGLVLFCGGIYLSQLEAEIWIGKVTPIGGASIIAGWLCLLISMVRGLWT